MYYEYNGKVIGVLNDYDLSILNTDDKRILAKERTGTAPFMARWLLVNFYSNDPVKHVYGECPFVLYHLLTELACRVRCGILWICSHMDHLTLPRGQACRHATVLGMGTATQHEYTSRDQISRIDFED